MDRNDELMHAGKAGMMWGYTKGVLNGGRTAMGKVTTAYKSHKIKKKRKASLEKARVAKAEKAKQAEEKSKQAAKYEGKPKAAKYMTEDELNKAIARMELEKRYIDLLRDTTPKKQVSRGQKFVTDVLETSGKNIATQATAFAMGYGANKLLNKIFEEPNAVDPRNIQKKK